MGSGGGGVKVDRLGHSGVLKTGLEEKYLLGLLLGVNVFLVLELLKCDTQTVRELIRRLQVYLIWEC